jgi:hypothetical protein
MPSRIKHEEEEEQKIWNLFYEMSGIYKYVCVSVYNINNLYGSKS